MTVEAFNTVASREVERNFTTKRQRSLPTTTRFWLVRNTAIRRAEYVIMDVLGIQEAPHLQTLIPLIMNQLDSGIPPLPQNITAAQLWPASAPIIDHMAFFSTFPDSRPCPSSHYWNKLRSARVTPSGFIQEMHIQQITVGVSTMEEIHEAA